MIIEMYLTARGLRDKSILTRFGTVESGGSQLPELVASLLLARRILVRYSPGNSVECNRESTRWRNNRNATS